MLKVGLGFEVFQDVPLVQPQFPLLLPLLPPPPLPHIHPYQGIPAKDKRYHATFQSRPYAPYMGIVTLNFLLCCKTKLIFPYLHYLYKC